ncbi:hypothetical protein ABEB36_011162 [Hypothenemus hampei]|uniref:Uncharacterized protein n=1 Tax=Hypothenemus hampei TaxID=57062 RepID=A0ABD1EEE0_HYPHA
MKISEIIFECDYNHTMSSTYLVPICQERGSELDYIVNFNIKKSTFFEFYYNNVHKGDCRSLRVDLSNSNDIGTTDLTPIYFLYGT